MHGVTAFFRKMRHGRFTRAGASGNLCLAGCAGDGGLGQLFVTRQEAGALVERGLFAD